jgi:hypothetical protein
MGTYNFDLMRLRYTMALALLVAACGADSGDGAPTSGAGGSGASTGSGSASTTNGASTSSATTSGGSTTGGAGGSGGGTTGGGTAGGGGTSDGGGGSAGGAGAGGRGGSAGTGGAPPVDGGTAAGVRWVGRVDFSDRTKPRFGWSGTGFVARFSGTSIGVTLNNADAYFFQPVIDGVKGTRFQAARGTATRQVAAGLAPGMHTLELYREIEASYGVSQFIGITEATLVAAPPGPGRLIEFVGDSITAGYGNLGTEPHPNSMPCHYTYDTQSAYMSYGAVTARALAADASLIAASGWGVYRSLGGDMNQVLPKVFANTLGYTAPPTWDFAIKPDAVVVDLGTNDFNQGDPGMPYATALGTFVDTIRSKYPNAWIFLALGTMLGMPQHDQAKAYMQSVVTSHNGDAGKIAFVDMGTQDALKGTGCDWHPSTAEDQRMGDVLAPAIKQKLGW